MKTAALISGGVDSSVALALLKEQGHSLTAFYLKIWLEDELAFMGTCPWEEDLSYVKAVCSQFNVPVEIVSLQQDYWDQVVSYTIAQIKAGRTPNPDILCNQRVKFGAFFGKIDNSFEYVATGHYAQVDHSQETTKLLRSPDPIKDQTYFLSHLTQAQIARALFPIGHLHKHEVRELAVRFNLPTKDRKDSQGICFLGKLKFTEFIRYHVGDKEGYLVEFETGKKVGKHKGFWYYTIGQRQGIGLAGGPWYVVAKNTEENVVFVSRAYYSDDKNRRSFQIGSCNWISGSPSPKERLSVKMRHGQHINECSITKVGEDRYAIVLDERDQGIAPGQFAVLYDNQECLGGGVII
jgi:tRNA-specific 2-thiouridylase